MRAERPPEWELWIWGIGLFLLTCPFIYQLTGLDPSSQFNRDISTMRRTEGSGAMLYGLRIAVALWSVSTILPHWKAAIGSIGRIWAILAFFVWVSLTILWSDTFSSSLNAAVALLPLIVTGYCAALRLPPHLFARSFVYSSVAAAVSSYAYVILLPHFGVHQISDASQSVHAGAWRGPFAHKNLFGTLIAIYAVTVMMAGKSVLKSVWIKAVLFVILMVLVVRSDSATALIIVIATPMLTWFCIMISTGLRALIVLCGVPLVFGIVSQLEAILALFGRDMTFTGRTSIWEIAPASVLKRPLHGYGFASTTYGTFTLDLFRQRGLMDPHNGYLDLVLGTGGIGLLLFLLAALVSGVVARRMYLDGGDRRQGAIVLFSVTAGWLLSLLSESQDKPLGPFAALGYVAFALVVYGRNAQTPVSDRLATPTAADRRAARLARRFVSPASPSHL